jgi:CubicO group peptidase (beta-lactamase class C family)
MNTARTIFSSLCLCVFVVPSLAADLDSAAVDVLVKDTLKAWEVPGVAVAIVAKGEVIYLKGHGVKELGKPDPVTPDTLFAIASCSKAFTTTVMAMLVADGKMAWDDPVRKHLPSFHLSNPLVDAAVTLRDIVSHRTGVRSHDMLWYRSPLTLEERVRRLAFLPVDRPFRASFHYQSSMFTAAGLAAAAAGKASWADLVRKRILDPLEMTGVVLTSPEAEKAADHASPHRRNRHGDVEVLPWYPLEEPEPAGSVIAGARDLARWVRFHLGDGTWNGRRLVAAEALAETHAPQTIIPLEGLPKEQNPEATQMRYGMGWVVQDYRGVRVVGHGGAIDGFRTQIMLLPDHQIGLVLLNNLDQTTMNLALANNLIDRLLDLPRRDWNAYYLGQVQRAEAAAAAKLRDRLRQRHPDTRPSRELAAYAGRYEHPAYGLVEVVLENGMLLWKWNSFRGPLEHYHYDTFVLDIDRMQQPLVTFSLNRDGEVTVMTVPEPLGVDFPRLRRK